MVDETRRTISRYLLWRTASAVGVLLCATSLVFLVLYAGPLNPAETVDAPIPKSELGLAGSLWAQYLHFMGDVLTFDFESWIVTTPAGTPANPTTDGNALVLDRLPQTLWLSLWAVAFALVVGLPVGLLAGLRPRSSIDTGALLGGTAARAAPAFLVAVIAIVGLRHSERVLFGFDWFGFAVETTRMAGTVPLGDLGTSEGFLLAVKRALPASVALGSALLGITVRVGRTAMRETRRANHLSGVRARGGGRLLVAKHLLRNASVALLSTLQAQTAVLLGGVVVVEYAFNIHGVGMLFEGRFVEDGLLAASITPTKWWLCLSHLRSSSAIAPAPFPPRALIIVGFGRLEVHARNLVVVDLLSTLADRRREPHHVEGVPVVDGQRER